MRVGDSLPKPGSHEAIDAFVPVRGFEGRYEVSNIGRVKSLRYFGYDSKVGFLKPRWSAKTPKRNNGRYASVRLIDKSRGLDESRLVHRMVAEAFLQNISCLPEVNHKDLNTENNHVSNL